MNRTLDRRTFLRGAVMGAVATLALPPLEIMMNSSGTAFANGTPIPKRFGVFFWGNGVVVPRWVPQQTGRDWTSDELRPLIDAGLKDYVSVASGYDIKTGNPRGHHAGAVGILSGAPLIPQDPGNAGYASTFSAPSIDQVVASHIGMGTRFKSIEFGVDPRVSRSEGTTLAHLSHNGPDNVNQAEYSPHRLFSRIFGDGFVDPLDVQIDPKLALRRNILDAVREDVHRLNAKLGASDKIRLDQHLEGVVSLQNRLYSIENAPPPPTACIVGDSPGEIGHDTAQKQRDRSRALSDLLALSLACDATRVWSNLFNGSVSGTVFWGIDPNVDFHQLTHDEPGEQPKVHQIVTFIMEEFAYLLNALKSTPEGDGNLLDHSVILASSDLASGYLHNLVDYPILLAGKGGGALRGGVHHRANRGNASEVLLTCLRAMDCPGTSFGVAGGQVQESVSAFES
ncbi:MAG: DUF1552 domain-containing protein [Bradymonadaceae bacterium]|nr:DUF1552 domain-containing protein [Lujinxingiaceae bacterium]